MPSQSAQTVHVKLPAGLAESAALIAAQEGMSLPEVLRSGLRAEIARRSPIEGANLNRLAAFGNVLAFRTISQQAFDAAVAAAERGDLVTSREFLGGSIVTAVLAAEHGDPFDQMKLSGLLLLRGDIAAQEGETEFATQLDGHGLARLDLAAEGGSDIAEASLIDVARGISPEAVAMASEVRNEMEAGR